MINLRLFPVLLLWFHLVNAQYGGYGGGSGGTGSTASTTSTISSQTGTTPAGATQTVKVGEDLKLTYDPDTLNVAPGGKVEFHFFHGQLGDHSVAEGSFDNPCHPKSATSFFSGFIAAPSGQEASTMFTLTVNDTNPIWIYCGQVNHCNLGMVGVINPPTSGPNTLDAFRTAAKNANGQSVPDHVEGGILSESKASQSTQGGSSNTAGGAASPTTTTGVAGKSALTGLTLVSIFALIIGAIVAL